MAARLLKVYLVVILCGGLYSCGQKKITEPASKEEKSITLIALGYADSATEQNKAFGIGRIIFVDLKSERISAYRKLFIPDTVVRFERFSLDSTVQDIGCHPQLLSLFSHNILDFVGNDYNPLTMKNLEDKEILNQHFNEYAYLIKIKRDSIEQYTFFDKNEFTPNLDSITSLLFNFTDIKAMLPTTKRINEDSILVPILNQKKYIYMPPAPEPPILPHLNKN